MGLDCYVVHGNDHDKAFTSEDDERLKDIALCGGMLSGSGSCGSFRGKVYEPLIDDLMQHEGHEEVSGIKQNTMPLRMLQVRS